MGMHGAFSRDYKVVLGIAKVETALTNANFPVSGSYVDVSGYEWVNVIVHLGTIADAVVFTMKQTDSLTGTLDTIDTANCVKTLATTDDGQVLSFFIATDQLAADHHFLSCTVSGTSGSNYADILFFLGGARHQPVTQGTTVMPSDNILSKAAA